MTAGPVVARLVYVVEVVVSEVPMKSALTRRAAIVLAAVDTKICPAAVAFAGGTRSDCLSKLNPVRKY